MKDNNNPKAHSIIARCYNHLTLFISDFDDISEHERQYIALTSAKAIEHSEYALNLWLEDNNEDENKLDNITWDLEALNDAIIKNNSVINAQKEIRKK